jgi:hypothetical protein
MIVRFEGVSGDWVLTAATASGVEGMVWDVTSGTGGSNDGLLSRLLNWFDGDFLSRLGLRMLCLLRLLRSWIRSGKSRISRPRKRRGGHFERCKRGGARNLRGKGPGCNRRRWRRDLKSGHDTVIVVCNLPKLLVVVFLLRQSLNYPARLLQRTH